jgi:hypothetical protein
MARRSVLGVLAAAPWFRATQSPAAGGGSMAASVARLIEQSRAVPEAEASVSERMDFVSRLLLGTRYQADTLIGGPEQPERLVVRNDAFDCVTFCEFVLAVAQARNYQEFETMLRAIRYANGAVQWRERNHYFAEWCRSAVSKGICARIDAGGSIAIARTVNWGNLGRREVTIEAVAPAIVLAHGERLANGDIIGFVSRRRNLDFFHTGLVIVGDGGALILRHASETRRRVVDGSLASFVAANNVQYVTLLRPVERLAAARG